MSFKFAIVEFISNHSVATIPVLWFVSEEEEECFFPSKVSRNTIKKLASDQCESLVTWPKFFVRVLGRAATYERAKEKVTKALSQSDIGTTDQDAPVRKQTLKTNKHGRFITSKRISSDSDTDNEKSPRKKSNMLQPPSPPPRINSNVQYNPSSSTSVQSL